MLPVVCRATECPTTYTAGVRFGSCVDPNVSHKGGFVVGSERTNIALVVLIAGNDVAMLLYVHLQSSLAGKTAGTLGAGKLAGELRLFPCGDK